jgi:ABC-type multidrug transport system fused ATPase/permease subunit
MKAALRKLLDLLTPVQRRSAFFLIALMIGGMALETLGIGLVVPALTLLTRPELASGMPGIGEFVRFASGGASSTHLTIVGLLLVAVVYTLKCAYLAWLASRQMRFVYGVQANLSQRLLVGYLNKPYTFHLQHNSAELIRNVVNITNELTLTGLVSLLILIAEALVLAGIGSLLLYVEPSGTLIATFLLAGLGWALNHATRSRIRRAGEARNAHEVMRIKHLQQAIGGAKELKLLGREEGAAARYAPHNISSARIGQYHATWQALPKLWLELLAVLGLVVLVLSLTLQGKATATFIPTLGLFAAAAFRLIPSLNRILGSIQFIRFSTPVIDALHQELRDADSDPPSTPAEFPLLRREIRLENVAVRYPLAEARVISGIDLRIARGTTVGFIGESGAGKSTLIDALLGLLPLEHGRILSDDTDIADNLRGWQQQIGYVPQSIYLIDDSLRRNIAFGLPDERIDEAAIRRAMDAAQLAQFVGQLPEGLDTVVGERGVRLSGGQRQRIGIARALYHNPSILVLDEATSSLDSETEHGVMQAINALHGTKTILIVTHRLGTLEYCDQVVRLERGTAFEVPKSLAATFTDLAAEPTASAAANDSGEPSNA